MATNAALCPKCGANLDVVGHAHRCVPRETGPAPQEDYLTFRKTGDDSLKEGYRAYMREYMRKWRAKKRKAK